METVVMTNKTGAISVIAPLTKVQEYKDKGYIVAEQKSKEVKKK